MTEILTKFIVSIAAFVGAAFLCTYFSRKFARKEKYHITFEYRLFILKKDYVSGITFESFGELKDLGAEGWEIASVIEDSMRYTSIILKRETLHQS